MIFISGIPNLLKVSQKFFGFWKHFSLKVIADKQNEMLITFSVSHLPLLQIKFRFFCVSAFFVALDAKRPIFTSRVYVHRILSRPRMSNKNTGQHFFLIWIKYLNVLFGGTRFGKFFVTRFTGTTSTCKNFCHQKVKKKCYHFFFFFWM